MMDTLVQKIVEKTGIDEETARKALTTVIDELKSRLPAGLASQLDSALSGEHPGVLGTVAEKIGNIFHKTG